MAIQATNDFILDYAIYQAPYFRLQAHLPVDGENSPIDCVVYADSGSYNAGSGSITTLPVYVDNSNAPEDNNGTNVINKYLLYISEKTIEILEELSPETTFTIVEVPVID